MTADPGGISVHLLADRPDLVEPVGTLRWREWGHPPEPVDRSWWLEVTRQEAPGRSAGELGRCGRPWPGRRRGWVATGDPSIGFYERCGWRVMEKLRLANGLSSTVLAKVLDRP